MKPKILIQAILSCLILLAIRPAFAESTNTAQIPSTPEETSETIEEEQDEGAILEARIDALNEFISVEVNATDLEKGKKLQLRSMAIAAYRENDLNPLWPDVVELEDEGENPDEVADEVGEDSVEENDVTESTEEPASDTAGEIKDVVDENVTVIAEAGIEKGGEEPIEEIISAPLNPDDQVFESLRLFLAVHGFEETDLSFGPKAEADKPDYPIPAKDLMITLALAEVCLRLKQGPDSVSEWPNWTFNDHPESRSTKDHYNELTSRFGETASKAPDPIEIAEDFVPKNWVYHRIHQAIQGGDEMPEPPQIKVDGLVKVGNDFSQARELADFLLREEFLLEEDMAEIDGVYTKPLSEGVRAFQKSKSLQSDGILGPSTAKRISQKVEDEMEKLHINLHRARRLPDDLGDRYLLANLPAGEVYGFADDKEELRMRVVFGKHKPGQHTPIFRDKMENVVFRPYWNVPYSIAVSEAPYSDLSYLENNGFNIVSNSGAELPLTVGSLESVRSRNAFVRQDGGDNNALGLVKFLFPNRHAVYFHDTPFKHYFKNSYRAQSHGCVRLEKPEAMANWVLGDSDEWSPEKINSSIHTGSRKSVDLETPIPVYVVYFTAFPDAKKESGVDFHRDYYDYDLPGAVVDAPGPKPSPTKLPEAEKKGGLFKFLRGNNQSNRSNSPRGGLFERLKGKQN